MRCRVRTGLLIAVLLGVVCRLVQYAWRRSYWHDESYLVLNLIDGTPADAFGPLKHDQSAPPLFLLIQFAVKSIAGTGEYALRAVPLLAGCAGVVLFALLARRLTRGLPYSSVAAVLATLMFALSDRLVWHSTESKQYSTDVLVALLLLLAATARQSDARRLIACSVIATLAVWLSHPTVFTFGGIALAILLTRRVNVATWLACCVAVGGSFVAVYLSSVRYQQSEYLYNYWLSEMVPWRSPGEIVPWLIKNTTGLFDYPYEDTGPLLLLMGVVGVVTLWRRRKPRLLALLLLPAGLNFIAAALHRFPFGGKRVTVFLSPSMLLLAAIGTAACVALAHRRWSPRYRRIAWALPAAIVGWGLVPGLYDLFVPKHNGHLRPAAEFVRANRVGDEPVYVLGETEPLDCYWRAPGVGIQSDPESLPRVTDESFWVVYAYSTKKGERQRQAAVDATAKLAPITAHFQTPGGAAYRFSR